MLKRLALAFSLLVAPVLTFAQPLTDSGRILVSNGSGQSTRRGALTVGTAYVNSLSALRSLTGGVYAHVLRTGYSSTTPAPPLTYVWQATCAGPADNIALYVTPRAGGLGCWSAAADSNVGDIREWGASTSADSAGAIQACLEHSPIPCEAKGGKYPVLSNVLIPANATLDCKLSSPDAGNSTSYGSMSALMLSTSISITYGGAGGAIQNCLMYPNGFTFGAANTNAFAGTAIRFINGSYGSTLQNVALFGFAVDVDNSRGAGRLLVQHVNFDGTGTSAAFTGSISGNKLTVTAISSGSLSVGQNVTDAALPIHVSRGTFITAFGTGTGGVGGYTLSTSQTVPRESMVAAAGAITTGVNGDTNIWRDLRGAAFSTGAGEGAGGDCAAEMRAGIGFLDAGGTADVFDDDYVQDYATADFEFLDGVLVSGGFQADQDPTCAGAPHEVVIRGGTGWNMYQGIVTNSAIGGILIYNNPGNLYFAYLSFNALSGDCLDLGQGTTGAGNVTVNALFTNRSAASNCKYAVNFVGSGATNLMIKVAYLNGVNGGSAPYIYNSDAGHYVLGRNLQIGTLYTDLPSSAVPYSGFSATYGSDGMMSGLPISVGRCTGLGSGNCSLIADSDAVNGAIVLSPKGSPGTSGVAELTFPTPAASFHACQFTLQNGSASWPAGSKPPTAIGGGSSHAKVSWGATLTARQTYAIAYHCSAV